MDESTDVESHPDFAVIWSFFQKFGKQLDLEDVLFTDVANWFSNSVTPSSVLVEMMMKLMRKTGMRVDRQRWQRHLIKAAMKFDYSLGTELQSSGFNGLSLARKMYLFKLLCEMQFDDNMKFKSVINMEEAAEQRIKPVGRDEEGLLYWHQEDEDMNIRLYIEDEDEDDEAGWKVICRSNGDIKNLIRNLKDEPTDKSKEENSDEEEDIVETKFQKFLKSQCTTEGHEEKVNEQALTVEQKEPDVKEESDSPELELNKDNDENPKPDVDLTNPDTAQNNEQQANEDQTVKGDSSMVFSDAAKIEADFKTDLSSENTNCSTPPVNSNSISETLNDNANIVIPSLNTVLKTSDEHVNCTTALQSVSVITSTKSISDSNNGVELSDNVSECKNVPSDNSNSTFSLIDNLGACDQKVFQSGCEKVSALQEDCKNSDKAKDNTLDNSSKSETQGSIDKLETSSTHNESKSKVSNSFSSQTDQSNGDIKSETNNNVTNGHCADSEKMNTAQHESIDKSNNDVSTSKESETVGLPADCDIADAKDAQRPENEKRRETEDEQKRGDQQEKNEKDSEENEDETEESRDEKRDCREDEKDKEETGDVAEVKCQEENVEESNPDEKGDPRKETDEEVKEYKDTGVTPNEKKENKDLDEEFVEEEKSNKELGEGLVDEEKEGKDTKNELDDDRKENKHLEEEPDDEEKENKEELENTAAHKSIRKRRKKKRGRARPVKKKPKSTPRKSTDSLQQTKQKKPKLSRLEQLQEEADSILHMGEKKSNDGDASYRTRSGRRVKNAKKDEPEVWQTFEDDGYKKHKRKDSDADDDFLYSERKKGSHGRSPMKEQPKKEVQRIVNDDTPCMKCGLYSHPETILLCDGCDKGHHMACLTPPLMIVPYEEWFCPKCSQLKLIERLKEIYEEHENKLKHHQRKTKQIERKKLLNEYTGISETNIIKEEPKPPKPRPPPKRRRSYSSDSQSDELDYSSPSSPELKTTRRCRTRVSYDFSSFDKTIMDAIKDDIVVKSEVVDDRPVSGKDIRTIIAAEKGEDADLDDNQDAFIPGKRKKRKLTNLNSSEDEVVESGSNYSVSESEEVSEEEYKDESNSMGSEEEVGGGWRSRRNKMPYVKPVKRSKRLRRKRIQEDYETSLSESSEYEEEVPKKKAKKKKKWNGYGRDSTEDEYVPPKQIRKDRHFIDDDDDAEEEREQNKKESKKNRALDSSSDENQDEGKKQPDSKVSVRKHSADVSSDDWSSLSSNAAKSSDEDISEVDSPKNDKSPSNNE